ncbi:MAG: right-handed parallel beta-helix repeat-containing protein, partial [Myxococcales bacterium]|nr:right-handed parallel beta-helix repeat-containing protein [Myxococcales bacterium]
GECMYLGCNDNACQMWDSVIEWNWCHDTLAGAQGDGIELKTGSYNTVVRHNVIHDVKYPGITMYGTVGNKPANVVDGNVIWNVQDNGIQTVGDVIVRNNIVMNVGASGIAAKPSQGEIVENMTIAHNTVMGAGDACLRVNELDAGGNNVIANNALYCANSAAIKFPNGTGAAIVAGNAVVGSVNGPNAGTFDGVDPSAAFLDAPGMDFYPVDGGPLVDAGDAGQTVAQDFNCLDREPSAPEVGAYDWSTAQNPGWEVQPGFKECAGDPSGTDTDGTDTDPTTDTDDPSTSSDTDDPTITATDTDDPTTSSGTETGDTTAGTSGTNGATDTGVTGTGGSDSGDSSGGTTAGTDTGSDETGDEGCGCVASDRGESALAGLLLVLGLGLSRTRRRA